MRRHVGNSHQTERQERDQRVEDRYRDPHVAKCLWKHAFGLFLDEVGRALETGDTEHRRGKPEEERCPDAAFDGHCEVFGEDGGSVGDDIPAAQEKQEGE